MRRRLAGLLAAALACGLPGSAAAVDVSTVTGPETGVTAWFVQSPALPLVSVEMRFPGGAALDPEGKPGTASLAGRLLTEGAGERGTQAYNAALDRTGLQLSVDVGREATRVSAKALTETLDAAAPLIADALARPRFDAGAFKRGKRQARAALAQRASSPAAQGYRRLRHKLFPAGHPYARRPLGTKAGLAEITQGDLAAFADRQFVRTGADVALVGDLSRREAGRLIDRIFVDLPQGKARQPVPAVEPSFDGSTTVIERPLPQTLFFAAGPAVTRDSPDFYAADLLSEILGGDTFLSRLGRQIRVERGLAYSVGSGLAVYERAAFQVVRASTAHARAGEAHKLLREIFAELGREGPTAEELKAAKRRVVGSMARRLTSSDGLARVVLSMKANGLGRDYLDRRAKLIRGVSQSEITALAKDMMPENTLTAVAIGQPQGLD